MRHVPHDGKIHHVDIKRPEVIIEPAMTHEERLPSMAAYRDTFAIHHTLPYDESELTPNAERHGHAVVR